MAKKTRIRLGGGAGYETDWIAPAVVLAEQGQLDYLCFECLAEESLALSQAKRHLDPTQGFNSTIEARMRACLPACVRSGTKVIGNFGAANAPAAAELVGQIAIELGYPNLKIATVTGDDVRHLLEPDMAIWDFGGTLADLEGDVIAANAYLGIEPIVEALELGADIVVTGRVADPSLFVAPMVYEFGWAMDDWPRIGQASAVGHLLECSAYVTGGNYWDPGYTEDVPDLHKIGFPIGEVNEDASATITKVEGTGGLVTTGTCKAQFVYELGDPARHMTPDVIADYRYVELSQQGADQVRISGGTGAPKPTTLKVNIGVSEGWIGECESTWAGPGSLAKAKVTGQAVEAHLKPLMNILEDFRLDYVGVNSVFGEASPEPSVEPNEVWLRVAARTRDKSAATTVSEVFSDLGMATPLGAGGQRMSVCPVVGVYSTSIDRERIVTQVDVSAAADMAR